MLNKEQIDALRDLGLDEKMITALALAEKASANQAHIKCKDFEWSSPLDAGAAGAAVAKLLEARTWTI